MACVQDDPSVLFSSGFSGAKGDKGLREEKKDQEDHVFTGPKRDCEANVTSVTGGACGQKVQFYFIF